MHIHIHTHLRYTEDASVCGAVTRDDVAALVIKALLSEKADGKVRVGVLCRCGYVAVLCACIWSGACVGLCWCLWRRRGVDVCVASTHHDRVAKAHSSHFS